MTWILNGSVLENLQLSNVEEQFSDDGIPVGILMFNEVPIKYNKTRIQCMAELETHQSASSTEALLLIQGFKLQT